MKQPNQAVRAVVKPIDGKIPVQLINRALSEVVVHKDTQLATVTPPSGEEVHRIGRQSEALKFDDEQLSSTDILEMIKHEPKFEGLDLSQSVLAENDRLDLLRLLYQYRDIFAMDDHDLSSTPMLQHSIATGDAQAVRLGPYRSAFANREVIRCKIDDLLKHKIIQPSSSEWASPIVLVRKKDGSWRMCVDLKKVKQCDQEG